MCCTGKRYKDQSQRGLSRTSRILRKFAESTDPNLQIEVTRDGELVEVINKIEVPEEEENQT